MQVVQEFVCSIMLFSVCAIIVAHTFRIVRDALRDQQEAPSQPSPEREEGFYDEDEDQRSACEANGKL